jgi:hypothetical protein
MLGERCVNCQQNNPPGNSHCLGCGAPLNQKAVVVSLDRSVVRLKSQLPSRQLKRLGASVAVAAVTLLAEAGYIYLRRRVQGVQGPLLPKFRRRALPATVETRTKKTETSGKRVVTFFSERVVEERRWGRPVRRIVDRFAWRSEETVES